MNPPNKPKRPSARSSVRPSTMPPAPESRPEPRPAEREPAASTAKASEKKGARVSARRGPQAPAPNKVEAKATPAQPEAAKASKRTEVESAPRPKPNKPAAKARPVAREEPAPAPVEVAPQAAAPLVEQAPEQPAPEPIASTPVFSGERLNGHGVHAAEAVSTRDPSDSLESSDGDDDDEIWSEADAGPFVSMAELADEGEAESGATPAGEGPGTGTVSRLARSRRDGQRDEAVRLGSAQTLVSTDYYFRQYGAHGIRSLTAEVDEFGLDPHVEEKARPWLEGLCKRYFRVDVDGTQHLPSEGRVMMVCNRAGALPWDGLVLRTAVRMARPKLQPVRWLAEDSVFHYPFLGVFMNRLGAVRACPENAERLLRQQRLVAVFPEGAHGSGKLFKDRYRLQRFGRGGYVKLALKHGAPIVPTAIIGSEETNPVLGRSRFLGRALGSESLPITPTFPWLGAAGLLPAPVKWRIVVGEPIDLSSYGPASADDALVVHRLNEQIRGILQGLVDQARSSRRHALFG